MLIRAKSPLRIGLAGGGTDVSPYCDMYGGQILNACINMFAYATIEPTTNNKIVLFSADRNEFDEQDSSLSLIYNQKLDLIKAVYNRIVKDFINKPLSFKITTYVDAPAGSGLGSSSTLVVTVLKAFVEWLKLPLTEYDIAKLAWSIEREDMNMSGGLQDQYATAFGGFNYMEFQNNHKVIVNPLRIKKSYIYELENNLVLYYTGTSRLSAQIIDSQIKEMNSNNSKQSNTTIEALHRIKESATNMKNALLTGKINEIGEILDDAWQNKKKTSSSISNAKIDELYEVAKKAGATGGKISGAGGGGFFMFYCPNLTRYPVIEQLNKFGGQVRIFAFEREGASSWITR